MYFVSKYDIFRGNPIVNQYYFCFTFKLFEYFHSTGITNCSTTCKVMPIIYSHNYVAIRLIVVYTCFPCHILVH